MSCLKQVNYENAVSRQIMVALFNFRLELNRDSTRYICRFLAQEECCRPSDKDCYSDTAFQFCIAYMHHKVSPYVLIIVQIHPLFFWLTFIRRICSTRFAKVRSIIIFSYDHIAWFSDSHPRLKFRKQCFNFYAQKGLIRIIQVLCLVIFRFFLNDGLSLEKNLALDFKFPASISLADL